MTTAAFLQAEKTLVISSQKEQTHLAKQHQLFSCTSPGVFWPFPTYFRILGWLLLPILFAPLFHPHPQLALLQVSKASLTFHVSKFTSLKLLRCFLAPALSTQTEIPPCKVALLFCSLAPLTKSQKVLNTPVLGMPDKVFLSVLSFTTSLQWGHSQSNCEFLDGLWQSGLIFILSSSSLCGLAALQMRNRNTSGFEWPSLCWKQG